MPLRQTRLRPPRPGYWGPLLKHSAHTLRKQMCTDGLHAVVHGREWHGERGGVWVDLYPRCG